MHNQAQISTELCSKYAQEAVPLSFFWTMMMISSFLMLSSFDDCPAKSYRALYVGCAGVAAVGGASTGGGGGGGAFRVDDVDVDVEAGILLVRIEAKAFPFVAAAGCTGSALDRNDGVLAGLAKLEAMGRGTVWGVGLAVFVAGRALDSFEGPPPGPPGRRSFPFVIGLPAMGVGFGVGLETEPGGSPGPV